MIQIASRLCEGCGIFKEHSRNHRKHLRFWDAARWASWSHPSKDNFGITVKKISTMCHDLRTGWWRDSVWWSQTRKGKTSYSWITFHVYIYIHRVLLPWKSGWKNLSVYMEVVYVQFLGKKWNWATGPANAEKQTVNLLHGSSSSDMSVTYSSWKCENWDWTLRGSNLRVQTSGWQLLC